MSYIYIYIHTLCHMLVCASGEIFYTLCHISRIASNTNRCKIPKSRPEQAYTIHTHARRTTSYDTIVAGLSQHGRHNDVVCAHVLYFLLDTAEYTCTWIDFRLKYMYKHIIQVARMPWLMYKSFDGNLCMDTWYYGRTNNDNETGYFCLAKICQSFIF